MTVTATVSLSCGEQGCKTYLAVGTQYYQPGLVEASEGRILLFEGRTMENVGYGMDDNTPNIIASFKTKGCVFSLTDIQGRLVAAINESVRKINIFIKFGLTLILGLYFPT